MKRLLSVFTFLILSATPVVFSAQNLPTVTPERIQKLQELHKKAEQQIALNNFHGAMGTYQEILFFEPDDETAYTAMGQIYLLFGDFKKAAAAFQNALSIDPENETALAGLQKIKGPGGPPYPETNPDPPAQSSLEGSADRKN